jgi:ParB-like chromosome segregation protein Spo0J
MTGRSPKSDGDKEQSADEGAPSGPWAVREVPLDSLGFGFTPRAGIDRDHVRTLAEVVPALPPVLVHTPSMHVIDGVHRVLAARMAGQKTIAASMVDGTQAEASISAIQHNVQHGMPLTLSERQAAARKVVGLRPDWSDRRVGAICGLSPNTVAKVRVRATAQDDQLTARIGRDGRARPIDPAEQRRRIAEALVAEPEASLQAIAKRTGSAKATVRDVRDRIQNGADILPPRLQRSRNASRRPIREPIAEVPVPDEPARKVHTDQAFTSSESGQRFIEWFNTRRVDDDAEWLPFIDAVPLSRVYEIADAAYRCGDLWHRFAAAVSARANGRRAG